MSVVQDVDLEAMPTSIFLNDDNDERRALHLLYYAECAQWCFFSWHLQLVVVRRTRVSSRSVLHNARRYRCLMTTMTTTWLVLSTSNKLKRTYAIHHTWFQLYTRSLLAVDRGCRSLQCQSAVKQKFTNESLDVGTVHICRVSSEKIHYQSIELFSQRRGFYAQMFSLDCL